MRPSRIRAGTVRAYRSAPLAVGVAGPHPGEHRRQRRVGRRRSRGCRARRQASPTLRVHEVAAALDAAVFGHRGRAESRHALAETPRSNPRYPGRSSRTSPHRAVLPPPAVTAMHTSQSSLITPAAWTSNSIVPPAASMARQASAPRPDPARPPRGHRRRRLDPRRSPARRRSQRHHHGTAERLVTDMPACDSGNHREALAHADGTSAVSTSAADTPPPSAFGDVVGCHLFFAESDRARV